VSTRLCFGRLLTAQGKRRIDRRGAYRRSQRGEQGDGEEQRGR
jgi:hypothetical protein